MLTTPLSMEEAMAATQDELVAFEISSSANRKLATLVQDEEEDIFPRQEKTILSRRDFPVSSL